MRLLVLVVLAAATAAVPAPATTFEFMAQTRVERPGGAGYDVVQERVRWEADKTAIVVCNMWDRHPCPSAAQRIADLAPAIDAALEKARGMGMLVVHAPAGVADHYSGMPQRKKSEKAREARVPRAKEWRYPDPDSEPPLPIDTSGGGCDCPEAPCPQDMDAAPRRQIETIAIGPDDAITDDGQELYNLLEAEDRENVIVVGAGAETWFGASAVAVRANVNHGKNAVVLRDLTDALYDHRAMPYVDHYRGVDLLALYSEAYWCPTTLSTFLTGAPPHRFANDDRVHAVFLLNEPEYETATTVPRFAEEEIAQAFGWRCTYLTGIERHSIPGLHALEDADLLFVSVHRTLLPPEDLALIQAYCKTGKPVVGIRTASHAFASRRSDVPDGRAEWVEFDADILGGHYTGHLDNKDPDTPRSYVWTHPAAGEHSILTGVRRDPFVTTSWIYEAGPLEAGTMLLMEGAMDGDDETHPIAWTNITEYGGRVFYTSLGHPDDFANPNLRRMLVNGIVWALAERFSNTGP